MSPLTGATKAETDVVLIGAGIMSATLGALLKQLEPGISIEIFERLDSAALESSDAWNNAGTGHSAFCELNYTPELADGSIDISKAIKIAESFEESKQFWTYLILQNLIDPPESFIRKIPHMSFVWGDKNVVYLRKRYNKLHECHLFNGMQFSEDVETLREWMPLVMEGRNLSQKVAATRMEIGTDVNFGALTQCIFQYLKQTPQVSLHFNSEVRKLKENNDGKWQIKVKNLSSGQVSSLTASFVFIGAGGGSLPLLLKSGIPEGKGFGGFPVSGQWLRCNNEAVIKKHHAKVYGMASVGSPPMSVPHLDTRLIKGKQELLFGPYAGFTTKFLKQGSFFDLISSIRFSNIIPMLSAGIRNIPLTKYLIDQVSLTPEARLNLLREYVPEAQMEDWEMEIAGQRVQVIKKDKEHGGILEFGTEVVSASNGSLAALLGASPGASTAVSIMLNIMKRCFADRMASSEWKEKIREIVPSYGLSLGQDAELLRAVREMSNAALKLQ